MNRAPFNGEIKIEPELSPPPHQVTKATPELFRNSHTKYTAYMRQPEYGGYFLVTCPFDLFLWCLVERQDLGRLLLHNRHMVISTWGPVMEADGSAALAPNDKRALPCGFCENILTRDRDLMGLKVLTDGDPRTNSKCRT